MKKSLIFILTPLILYSQDITEKSLPLRAKNFININFPGNTIESVELYQDGAGYEVGIDYGFNFIFYDTGLWKSVSVSMNINDAEDANLSIPRSCLHKSVINSIDREYPHSRITYIERRNKTFLIVLNGETEIEISGYGIIVNERKTNEN